MLLSEFLLSILCKFLRFLQENERLKETISEKTTQIENQNNKISDLLQQNQKQVFLKLAFPFKMSILWYMVRGAPYLCEISC